MSEEMILDIKDLRTSFFVDSNEVKAVDGVTFQVPKGKTLGIVEKVVQEKVFLPSPF